MKENDISVNYAGLRLKNPIMVSSSGLTDTPHKIKILEKCGASAAVLKSLFEEQIMMNIQNELQTNEYNYTEAPDFLRSFITADHVGNYLRLIEDSKKTVEIPIIASINACTLRSWIDFAKQIESAGADAIEVNIMLINTDKELNYGVSEQLHIDILAEMKKTVKIPVIMKISRQFSNLVGLINQLQHNDANGIVLFNRSYTPDINIKEMKFAPGPKLTHASTFYETLRWIGIVSGLVPGIDIAASSGVHTAENMIKALLAGATVTQVCSVVYNEGPDIIAHLLSELNYWMSNHGFENIRQFRGSLNFANIENENFYVRTQFMRYFSNKDNFPPQ